jgi:hypothetical protein
MVDAVNFFQRLGVTKIAIIGGYESYAIVGFLRENKVSVILNKIHQLPISEDEDISLPYRLPKILADSGVVFALGYDY